MSPPRRLVVGISGASGAPYARCLLEFLASDPIRRETSTSVVLSTTAREVWGHECGGRVEDFDLPVYDGRDYGAPFASGSSAPDAMVIVPASMSTVARLAHGMSDNLLTRAADVVLKEKKRLVVVPREAPYSVIHLENMLSLARSGAVILPASPAFYGMPTRVSDLVDSVVARLCDHLGLTHALGRRWGHEVTLEKRA